MLAWRRTFACDRQSELEHMLFRYKKLVDDDLKVRNEDDRKGKSITACNTLNRLILLGIPQGELVV